MILMIVPLNLSNNCISIDIISTGGSRPMRYDANDVKTADVTLTLVAMLP